MINHRELELLKAALDTLAEGYRELPDFSPELDPETAGRVIDEVARRMRDNYPYHHPLYAGQMLKPPHPVARIAYALSLWVNPNNHALDGGRASSALEIECIGALGQMFGWQAPLGHLTGGGTMANLEALWVAGRLHPGKRIVASTEAHYTHRRLCEVLGLPFAAVGTDSDGRMDVGELGRLLAEGNVGSVVATMGTTGSGALDRLPRILELARAHDVRVHADAAYGGYFTLASLLDAETRASFDALSEVDSIVVDPHKHGLQPYGCGCVLFRDPTVGRFYRHDSPYTYFSSAELHLGEISLECSRPGAAAVALWATQQLLPYERDGAFSRMLDDCLQAARDFHARLEGGDRFLPMSAPELDIVVYAVRADRTSAAGNLARRVFDAAASEGLHLALIDLPADRVRARHPDLVADTETVTCLRSVLMKPEHRDWVERIAAILENLALN